MQNIKINKLPNSMIEIEGELEADIFEGYYNKALKKISEHVEIDGFRKGKAPESVLLSKIPDVKILEEMAEMALTEHYPKILTEGNEKIDAIGHPEISITKLARKNPLGFKIKTAVLPEIKLGDYKTIAKKINSEITTEEKDTTVTDEDVEKTIMDIRKSRAPKKHISETDAKEGEINEELPEFNDEFVKALGPFENVDDFKNKLKINLKLEKENQLKEKIRIKIIEKIIDESTLEVPELFINMELDKILYRMQSDITTMGLKFEDYLKHINKSLEDLRNEFRSDAEKKAKLSLILNEIAKKEEFKVDEKILDLEVAKILEHYKDADPVRARMHAENVLINEQIFQMLENQA